MGSESNDHDLPACVTGFTTEASGDLVAHAVPIASRPWLTTLCGRAVTSIDATPFDRRRPDVCELCRERCTRRNDG